MAQQTFQGTSPATVKLVRTIMHMALLLAKYDTRLSTRLGKTHLNLFWNVLMSIFSCRSHTHSAFAVIDG